MKIFDFLERLQIAIIAVFLSCFTLGLYGWAWMLAYRYSADKWEFFTWAFMLVLIAYFFYVCDKLGREDRKKYSKSKSRDTDLI